MPTQENISDSAKRLNAYKNKGKDSDVSTVHACLYLCNKPYCSPVSWFKQYMPTIAYLISGAGLY